MAYDDFKALNKETRKKNLKALKDGSTYDWATVAEMYEDKISRLLDIDIKKGDELSDLIHSACYSSSIIKHRE